MPVNVLTRAEQVARARKASLSTVISEALSEGSRQHTAPGHPEEVLGMYKNALGGLWDEEMSLLDGIILG